MILHVSDEIELIENHGSWAQLNDNNHLIDFTFFENNSYHLFGTSQLAFDVKARLEKLDKNANIESTRSIINAFAFVFREVVKKTSAGADIRRNKFDRRVTTISRKQRSAQGLLIRYHI